jgi:hypothetical protein
LDEEREVKEPERGKQDMASQFHKIVEDYAALRVLIGFLGEEPQLNWWDTGFLSEAGLRFLFVNFPRSYFTAGCCSTSQAAKIIHDRLIGKGGVYHLFRLPRFLEEALHAQLASFDLQQVATHLDNKEAALRRLRSFFTSPVEAPEGPVQVGIAKKIISNFTVEEIAKHYHDALSQDKKTFPYLTNE